MTAVLLHLIVALAASLQGITGIGFALLAGPALLLVLNDGAALQIAALLSLVIALALVPGFWRHIDWGRLVRLGMGGLVALPFGLWLYAEASPAVLKLLAGMVIGALTLMMLLGPGQGVGAKTDKGAASRIGDLSAGGLAGLLGGALAMIGPAISLRLTATGTAKLVNRATVLGLFTIGYPLLFAGQAAVAGVTAQTLWTTLGYVPTTLAGAIAGQIAVKHVSETLFRRLVILFLVATAVSLLINAFRELL